MIGQDIAIRVDAEITRKSNEAGVPAEAGVVERAWRVARTDKGVGYVPVEGDLNTAFEMSRITSTLFQHSHSNLQMVAVTAVRGAGERQLLDLRAESVGSTTLQQRQRLDHFDCRARKDQVVDITDRDAAAAAGIEHPDSPAVATLNEGATRYFNKDRIDHQITERD